VYEIGRTLRDERMRRRLDIADCERATKIRGKYLRALEEEEFGMLPGPAYVKGFMRAYAQHLDLDPNLLLDEYASRFEVDPEAGPDGNPLAPLRPQGRAERRPLTRRPPPRRRRRGRTVLLVAGAGAAVVAGVLVWAGSDGWGSEPETHAAAPLRVALTGVSAAGSYVEVRRRSASGELVWVGRVAGGETRRLEEPGPLWLRIDRARSVRVRVNGHAWRPGAGSAFVLTRSGLAPAAT
jgi:hypothetical protein